MQCSSLRIMGSRIGMKELEDAWANFQLDEEESGGLEISSEEVGKAVSEGTEMRYALIGRFLTDKPINFVAMKNTMASIWEPRKGIAVTEVGAGRYLFQFFHEFDVITVLNNGPWTFNQHILVVRRLLETDQADRVPLNQVTLWVQIHNLPVGFHSLKIVKDIGDYVGQFLESDENNFKGSWRNFLRIRVNMDVYKPLKRRMKIKKSGGEWLWVDFRYERLNLFCFICGCLGHTDRKCSKLYEYPEGNVLKPYGSWMRASHRKLPVHGGDRWFRLAQTVVLRDREGVNGIDTMKVDTEKEGIVEQVRGVNEGPQPINWASFRAITKGKEIQSVDALTVGKPMVVAESSEHGLIVTAQKRRRVEEEARPSEVGSSSLLNQEKEIVISVQSEPMVGPGIQAHREP